MEFNVTDKGKSHFFFENWGPLVLNKKTLVLNVSLNSDYWITYLNIFFLFFCLYCLSTLSFRHVVFGQLLFLSVSQLKLSISVGLGSVNFLSPSRSSMPLPKSLSPSLPLHCSSLLVKYSAEIKVFTWNAKWMRGKEPTEIRRSSLFAFCFAHDVSLFGTGN